MQQFAGIVSILSLLALVAPQPPPPRGAPADNTAPNLGVITVFGRSVIRVPADTLRFDVRLFSRVADPEKIDSAGQTLAQTMRQNGVPDARWNLPLTGNLSSNSSGAVRGTIRKPTRDAVEAVARKIADQLPGSLSGSVQSMTINSSLSLDDCSAGDARAQDAAMADARARARRVASAAGLKLGKIVAVNEGNGFPNPACGTNYEDSFQRSPDDGFGSLDVPITVYATVTFAAT